MMVGAHADDVGFLPSSHGRVCGVEFLLHLFCDWTQSIGGDKGTILEGIQEITVHC